MIRWHVTYWCGYVGKTIIPTKKGKYPKSMRQAIRWADRKMRRLGYKVTPKAFDVKCKKHSIVCIETEDFKYAR